MVLNDNTQVFLDPKGDDHIVVHFQTTKLGHDQDTMLGYGTIPWQIAVRRALIAATFFGD